MENLKLVGSVQRGSNPDQNVKFNDYKKTGSSGVKGRVRSYSIYIENLKLVGSVQRVSNPDQKVNFNQYRALPTHPRVSAVVKPACLCGAWTGGTILQLGMVRLNSISIRKRILAGSKVGSGRGRACALY